MNYVNKILSKKVLNYSWAICVEEKIKYVWTHWLTGNITLPNKDQVTRQPQMIINYHTMND